MRLPCYVFILCSCSLSRKEQMKTPICVSHYKNILHITTGNSIQQVDILFAYVRHVGCVRVTTWVCSHQILSDDEQFFCICFPNLPLCLLCRSQVTCRKDFESNRANPKKTHMIWVGQEMIASVTLCLYEMRWIPLILWSESAPKHPKWLPQARCQLPLAQLEEMGCGRALQLLCTLWAWEDEICLLGFPPLIRSTGGSVCWNLCKKIDCVCCVAADLRYWGAALTLGWGSRNLLERNFAVSKSQLKCRLAVTGCHLCWIVND